MCVPLDTLKLRYVKVVAPAHIYENLDPSLKFQQRL